jgi:hypothetical protein
VLQYGTVITDKRVYGYKLVTFSTLCHVNIKYSYPLWIKGNYTTETVVG